MAKTVYELKSVLVGRCEELLRSKDEVIDVLKKQLAEADERFISNGKIYQDDVNLLSHRIEQSMEIVRNAYSEHIALLQVPERWWD